MHALAETESAAASWYDYFVSQLARLIPRFGLEQQSSSLIASFEMIFRESLATSYDLPPPNFSRLNFDGLPLQYSLAFGSSVPALQFIGEVAVPGSSNSARLRLGKERLCSLSELLGIEGSSFSISELLDEIVPESDQDLAGDPAGALWLSPGFSQSQGPTLTTYLNTKWGDDVNRLNRLDRFASYLGDQSRWQDFRHLTSGLMGPLGAAVTLRGHSPPTGRIYMSAYGRPLDYYATLSRELTGSSFHELFQHYTRIVLQEDCRYPTQSVVCSIGLGADAESDFKFEICGHCAFENDSQAKSRCLSWLEFLELDPGPYLFLMDVMAENCLSSTSSTLHAYLGIGLKRIQPYTTIYLKPAPVRIYGG